MAITITMTSNDLGSVVAVSDVRAVFDVALVAGNPWLLVLATGDVGNCVSCSMVTALEVRTVFCVEAGVLSVVGSDTSLIVTSDTSVVVTGDAWLVLVTGDVGVCGCCEVMTMSGGHSRSLSQKVTSASCTQSEPWEGKNSRTNLGIEVLLVYDRHTLIKDEQEVVSMGLIKTCLPSSNT